MNIELLLYVISHRKNNNKKATNKLLHKKKGMFHNIPSFIHSFI